MARVLAISSQVASGHVGLSAIVPALQAAGHEVVALPTIILSNHPGHPHVSGRRVDADHLAGMLDALGANGWLAGIDGILTGYLPSAEHVEFAERAIRIVKHQSGRRRPVVLCDPVLGDEPKGLYIAEGAAVAVRDRLVPVADVMTPNAFELGWLTGRDIVDAEEASEGAHILGLGECFVTSVATSEPGMIANLRIPRSGAATLRSSLLRHGVPNGTGDLFAALLLAAMLETNPETAFAVADRLLEAVVVASVGRPELALVANLPMIASAFSKPVA